LNVKGNNGTFEVLVGADTGGGILSTMTNHDLQLRAGGNSTKMIIKADGKVGVGTQTPEVTLHVSEVADVGPFAVRPGEAAPGRLMVTGSVAEVGFARRNLTAWPATPAAGDRYLWYSPDGTARFWTEVNGDLLSIGPKGDVTLTASLSLANSDIYFTRTDHAHTGFGNNLGFAAIENDGSGIYNALMILGRTVSANPLLRVVKMWDRFEMNGDAFKPGGGAWGVLSDGRLKKNIGQLSGVLDKLLSLRGVSFEWKDPEKHGNLPGTQMGLVAQDVEPVFPEWVGHDLDGTKTLSIRGFEALAIEAFRELKDEIKALKDVVVQLQSNHGSQATDQKTTSKTTKAAARKASGDARQS
jgi:hypothetical protein